MDEDIAAIVEPIVEAAQIPSRRRRDELRRELCSHFEDSGPTAEALRDAATRFGNAAGVGAALRTVYRRDYVLLYLAKVGASVAAAMIAATLIEALASLRLQIDANAWHLSPGFAHAAPFGLVVSLALVAAAEATRTPFTWTRALLSLGAYAIVSAGALSVNASSLGAFVAASILAALGVAFARAAAAWASRALLTLAAFAVVEYLWHQSLGIPFGAVRALAASGILVMLWASTITIVAISDRAFISAFKAA